MTLGDRRAGLGVGAVGRQLERVAERLVPVAAAEPARQVGPGRDHVVPAPDDRVEQRPSPVSMATSTAPASRYSWRTAWPATVGASRTGRWSCQ